MYRRVALWIVSGVLIVFGAILTYQFTNEFFLSNGYFKGTHNDFLAFWATGKLVAEGNIGQVYSVDALTAIQRTVVPHPVSMLGYMPFLNPPFVAVLLAPLGVLSVNDARLAWMVLSVIVMVAISWFLTSHIGNTCVRIGLILLLSTSYPVFQNLIQGQLSILIVALVIASIYLAERGKMLASGVLLSVLVIKPQLAVFVGIGLLAFRQWSMIKGMVLGAITILLLTLPFTGLGLYQEYVQFSSGVASGHFTGAGMNDATTWQGNMKYMYSLQGLAVMLFGQKNTILTNSFVAGVGISLIGLFAWTAYKKTWPSLRSPTGRRMMAVGISIILLINPHAYSQDAILLYALLAVMLPLWQRPSSAIMYFLAGVALLNIDQQTGSHWMTLALISASVVTLIPMYPRIRAYGMRYVQKLRRS